MLALLVVFAGVTASTWTGAVIREDQHRRARDRVDRSSTTLATAVNERLSRYVDTVQNAAAALGALPRITSSAFADVTAPLATQQQLTGAKSITLVVPSTIGELGGVQAYWRSRGAPDLVLEPVGTRTEHQFAIFSRGLGGNLSARGGTDGSPASALSAVLDRARATDQVVISDAYLLVTDASVPPQRRQLSFVVATTVRGDDRQLLGYLVLSIRGTDFMAATLRESTADLPEAILSTQDTDGRLVEVAAVRREDAATIDRRRTLIIAAGHRSWVVRTGADDAELLPVTDRTDLLVIAAGSLLALLFGYVLYQQATARRRAESAVRRATEELTQAEAQASVQAAQLSSVLTAISDGVAVVDSEGVYLVHNPAYDALAGITVPDRITPQDAVRRFGIFHSDGVTPYDPRDLPMARALEGEESIDVLAVIRNPRHPEGVVLSVTARPLDLTAGRRGAVAVMHDITERTRSDLELAEATEQLHAELSQRREAEAELRQARDTVAAQRTYLVQVLDALEISVVTCDPDGRIVHANRPARAETPGDDPPSTVLERTRHMKVCYPDGSPVPAAELPLLRALHGETVEGQELSLGDGRRIVTHARPLHHDDGHVIGAVISSYDISTLREREADLTAFAGVVAHDLNSPLAAIGGYGELITDDLAEVPLGRHGDEVRRNLDRIQVTVNRMQQLIDDLLAYSAARDAAINLVPVDLRAVVDDVVTARMEAIRYRPGSAGPPDIYVGLLPPVLADAGMLRQLIDNLVANAVKYTPPGHSARLDITARPAAEPGRLRVEVADRGIGIPEGQHEAIFTGFHRAHQHDGYAGTGLGLAICARVVQRHGGTIGVSDNPGGGALFHFTLSAAPADAGQLTHA